jgi:metal-responsive CopG/Arc/MetJ family transcriptional regulator
VKVAISVPDPVFKAAEHLAHRLRKSRSQLYSEAIAEYVVARDAKAITQKLDAIHGAQPTVFDEDLQHAQLDILSHEAW